MFNLYIKNSNVLQGTQFIKTDILVEDGKIFGIGNFKDTADIKTKTINGEGCYLIPGLIDIHTHGGNGIDIIACSEQELNELTLFYASQGVTSFLPTVGTVSKDKTYNALKKIKMLMQKGTKGSQILGVHMEGPYISEEYRGAQNLEDIKNPDIKEFQKFEEISNYNIKLVTIAPEKQGAIKLIEYLTSQGIATSIGHSGADYETCIEAIDKGVTSVTHFLNGMKEFHQHRPSIIGAALEKDIYCEMICDGKHLHPGTVRMLLKTKGPARLIMITDSIMAAGLGDGTYDGFIKVIVKDNDAKLESGMRAGSVLTAINAIRNVIKFTGMELKEVIPMMTENPAKLLNIYDKKGSIERGKDADMVMLNKSLDVMATICKGEIAYTNKEYEQKT
ncbi:N-acetylglucosamine-6-phosphate deacetylase [Tepidanaerobacter acetatoxydans]|uniref:N-acetylglucosamine-6-phosphate deacetylase n=1 Tax=Tepidanaerobacter acetatoxydans TaxID=499229 RepID=UPI001BD4E930|nr:N-acetylglucosamine-6-phosphate deacetylase [Tepidanaerobacter acetatoxydans]